MRVRRKRIEDKVSRLEKEIKELKERNRQLERQLKQKQRKLPKEYEEESLEIFELEKSCKECSRGFIEEVTIGNRRFERCSVCGWRGKTKKI